MPAKVLLIEASHMAEPRVNVGVTSIRVFTLEVYPLGAHQCNNLPQLVSVGAKDQTQICLVSNQGSFIHELYDEETLYCCCLQESSPSLKSYEA